MTHDPAVLEALQSTVTTHGASTWTEYQRCQRSHHLRNVVRLRPRKFEPDPLDTDGPEPRDTSYFEVGQLVHACLAYVRKGVMLGERRLVWTQVLEAAPSQSYDVGNCYEAERLLNAYWAHWGLDNGGFPEGVRIIGVEELIVGECGGMPLTTRADCILQIGDSIVVGDTKTRAQALPGAASDRRPEDPFRRADYARGLTTRPQFLTLCHLVQQAMKLPAPPEVQVDAIVKTKVPKLDRLTVPIRQRHVDVWLAAHAQLAAQGLTGDLPNYSQCAPEIGSRCWAFDWCHGSDDMRERLYQQGDET